MEDFIRDWGYIALFMYSFGGGFVGLIIAGVFSFSGELNLFISMIVAGASNFLGDQFLFYMARKNKIYANEKMKKFGRKIAYSHLLMRKYGSFVVFIQKYLYGVKTLVPLAMGLSKYSLIKFTIFNALSTILWSVLVGYAAFTAGEYVLSTTDEFKYVGIAIVFTILVFVYYMFKKIEKK
ncbi:MAG: DedA family protein [Arcobacter sp.]|nr:DedA family protein [Arcobacter sp.]